MSDLEVDEDLLMYVNLLVSAQAIINSIDLLKDTKYYKKKLKEFGQPFYTQIMNELKKDIHKIWKQDEILAMEMTRGIESIAKCIAENNSGALVVVDEIFQKGWNLSDYKLVKK
jgi:predicted AAA+ superfamily ATPase